MSVLNAVDLEQGPSTHGIPLSNFTKEYNTSAEIEDAISRKEIPSVITWKNLSVFRTTRKGVRKDLLRSINGQMAGGFNAIMGPSGSGKTTLLNALACRTDKNTQIEGETCLNGKPYGLGDLKKMAGYVMQDDLLNGSLTVEETLLFTARLKLPPAPQEEYEEAVDKVIGQMGLTNCRHTIIGTPLKKGISGGERKRVSVAIELLTRPSLLFLDEPTSGLDSVTSLSLCTFLKGLADSGECTVVCTIHQPQSRIFFLFDHLFLLKSGSLLFQGRAREALRVYSEAGFPVPDETNPADHLMDVITPSLRGKDDTQENAQKLKALKREPEVKLETGNRLDVKMLQPPPWHKQFYVLLQRCVKENLRARVSLIILLVQTAIIAALIGGVFYQLGNNQKSIRPRNSVLFFCVINQGIFGAISVINSFPAERVLSLRERKSGMYGASSYFMAKNIADSLIHMISPIIFSCVVYFMIGLQPSASKFFLFMFFMILCSLAATSLALMVSALCRTTSASVTVLPIVLEICRLFGGFFLSPANLPNYFSWLDALSYVKYSFVGIALNEFTDLTFTCDPDELKKDGSCAVTDGQQVIDQEGYDFITIGGCIGVLISFIIFFRFIAYLGIRYFKW